MLPTQTTVIGTGEQRAVEAGRFAVYDAAMAIEPGHWEHEPPQLTGWPVRVLAFIAGAVIATAIIVLLLGPR